MEFNTKRKEQITMSNINKRYVNMEYAKIAKLTEKEFMSSVGVDKITFSIIVESVRKYDLKNHEKGGRPNILDPENQVLLFFHNFFFGRTYRSIAQTFDVTSSTVNKTIKKVQAVATKVLNKENPKNMKKYLPRLTYCC